MSKPERANEAPVESDCSTRGWRYCEQCEIMIDASEDDHCWMCNGDAPIVDVVPCVGQCKDDNGNGQFWFTDELAHPAVRRVCPYCNGIGVERA